MGGDGRRWEGRLMGGEVDGRRWEEMGGEVDGRGG